MNPARLTRGTRRSRRPAFSLIEMAMALVLVGLVAMIALPSGATALGHARVNRAAAIVAGDLELALSAAAREHRPIRIAAGGMKLYLISRSNDTLQTRLLGTGSEFLLQTVTFSSAATDVFPTGLASGSLTITLTRDGYSRTVTMTRAGQVRVAP